LARKINKILLFVIKLIVSSCLLYFVLSKTEVEKVFSLIKTIYPLAFAASVLIYISSLYVSAMRWKLLLPGEFRVKRLFSLYLIGSFFNTFLPGAVGGDAVKSYYLYKEINKGSLSIASVFMDRYLGFISLMLMGSAGFILGFRYLKGSEVVWLMPLIILLFLILSLIIFGLRLGKGIKILSEFYEYFDYYRKQKALFVKAIFLSLIIQSVNTISMYIITRGLGQHIPLVYFFIFFPIIATISALPISIAGIGVREGSYVLLFGSIGIKPEIATAMSFAWFLSVATGGLAGLFEYLRLRK